MARVTRRKFLLYAAAGAAVSAGICGGADSGEIKMTNAFTVTSVEKAKQPGLPEGVSRIEYTSGADGVKDWALVMPPAKSDLWVVHIHGHGGYGDQVFTRPDIRQRWFTAYEKHGFGILSPNLRYNAWMSPKAAQDMHDLLGYVKTKYNVGKFMFVSGSMGGTSNLIYACLHPEDVAGVVALCPATDLTSYYAWCRKTNEEVLKQIADAIESAYGSAPAKNPKLYTLHSTLRNASKLTMPVYVCHGTNDQIIPVSQTRLLAAKMAESQTFVYTEIPDGHHDSPLAGGFDEGFNWVLGKISDL